MARLKKPDNETVEEAKIRHIKEYVSNFATRSEKTSWNRKQNNMEKLIDKLKPLEDAILEIIAQKHPLLDDMAVLRKQMVDSCIHPYDMLVVDGERALCKFCNKSITLPSDTDEAGS